MQRSSSTAKTPRKIKEEMEKHALSTSEREVCGFVYEDFYYPLRNLADDPQSFYADPAQVAYALTHYGEPVAVFHTHPEGLDLPSQIDRRMSYYNNSIIIIGTLDGRKLKLKEYYQNKK